MKMAAGRILWLFVCFLTFTTEFCAADVYDICNITIDAVTYNSMKDEVYIFAGINYWIIHKNGIDISGPIKISKRWHGFPVDFTHIDAMYERPDHNMVFFVGKNIYVFSSEIVIIICPLCKIPKASFYQLLSGYPKPISLLGLPDTLEKLDAAMVWGQNNKTYFYSGSMFWRFDEEEGRVEMDYPRNMSMWRGIGYDIDSAFTWRDGKTYFLKGTGLWKFNNLKMQVENAVPISFTQNWLRCYAERTESPSWGVVTIRIQISKCILPSYPLHATYTTNVPNAKPGEAFDIVAVNLTCQEGYGANGPRLVFCHNGQWSSPMPQCVPLCQLPSQPSVEYRCLVSLDWTDGFRTCNEFEPAGILVKPFCKTNYYSTTTLKFMHCIDGEWSNNQKCTPECGTLIPNGTELVLGGETATLGEVPWHAGIYTKTTEPYKQICGGSIISRNAVISAAHCFWSNLLGKLPATEFAVAVGKIYRQWNNSLDKAQWSDVEAVNIPVHFRGSATNYQDDVAVLVLNKDIEFNTYTRPVCLDFDINFERRQLQPQNKGKVAGWGLTAENGSPSQVLRVVDLPYVSVQTCLDESPASFTPYITSDKACAGYNNGSIALCRGDSGGGLAFPELDRGRLRYYLRGVASTAPSNDNLCNAYAYVSFTRLVNHEHFITRFWD